MELSTADEIAAAFDTVDALLEQAGEVAPAVALLAARAAERGITEPQLASHLHLTTSVLRWLLKLSPDATADRIDLDGADVGALLLKWARAAK
jgi:hypothetical protein